MHNPTESIGPENSVEAGHRGEQGTGTPDEALDVATMDRGGALSAVRAQCNYFGVWPY